jgi:hypothetical protein
MSKGLQIVLLIIVGTILLVAVEWSLEFLITRLTRRHGAKDKTKNKQEDQKEVDFANIPIESLHPRVQLAFVLGFLLPVVIYFACILVSNSFVNPLVLLVGLTICLLISAMFLGLFFASETVRQLCLKHDISFTSVRKHFVFSIVMILLTAILLSALAWLDIRSSLSFL